MKKVFLIVLTLVLTSSVAFAETKQESIKKSPISFSVDTSSNDVSEANIYGIKVGDPESCIQEILGKPESVDKSVTKDYVYNFYKYKLNGTILLITVVNGKVSSWTEVQ